MSVRRGGSGVSLMRFEWNNSLGFFGGFWNVFIEVWMESFLRSFQVFLWCF